MLEFNDSQMKRYSRHLILQGVGVAGQKKLAEAKVLIVGAGGLGSPSALYLTAAGVGEIGIVDDDKVELSNLQRQIIHTTASLDTPKVQSAKERLNALNPEVRVQTYHTRICAENILDIIAPYDLVLEGSDNFGTKFLVNDACVLTKKPLVFGGILRFSGQCMSIKPFQSACYACVFNSPPPADSVPSCASAGVLGAIAGMLGTIQATEALKIIIGIGNPLFDKILSFDALDMSFRKIAISRNPQCRVCGGEGIQALSDYKQESCWEL
ncbi:adenylyltransferase [Helicobacter sp. MIT 00-7814]|uniref:HesA/MoeB/ThiF family protein n=1 Tax=unclassified Helicobacter TaxID=2593540 RepID=UPI000E1F871D|nr:MULTISPECIES: molybdopterin-synthase adenylyltransferase MoeB [unclassified Helicobacter]RDU55035.1 adenylyltransferase [Helicobacter sp. MIT 00-7814]RDU55934.1 adenylyltransferase [Helicobacter sp. MIT 99-10781]